MTNRQRWGLESETPTRVAIRVAILGLATCLQLACNDLRLELRLDSKRHATWLGTWGLV